MTTDIHTERAGAAAGPPPSGSALAKARQGRVAKGEMSRGVTILWQIGVIVGVLVLWQLTHVFELGKPIIVQSPALVGERLVELFTGSELWPNLWSTMSAVVIALALSSIVGIPIGLFLGLLPRTRRVLAPFISALNATPRVALAPVFIILFGMDIEGKVALAFTIVVFIMVLNAQAGATSADPESLRLMLALGASKFDIVTKVVLPSAVPSILAGMRLGLIYSMLGVVTSELIASESGIGQMIARAAGVFDLSTVYSIVLVMMVIAAALNMLTEMTERRLLKWQPPPQK
ncbi:ABC transporter permease [Cryobacterium sp. TMS1-20-1]|uniref:ABC transporter permease n=1 Tax=Cryobacterium sp. TMS1-20-1 TaxID=1259223 RepID=UPI00106D9642|nr:ABC transporter permease [Cryobacterium sp. TMS1-20-1]TFC74891.1 ABC transporter permease [Cryobacterium sp. TMS1-20-1]